MSDHSRLFEYQENGLSYTVNVYEQDGKFFADITVNEGAMDVNAVYFGDSDLSGASAALKGPLNMNGGGSVYEGEPVQWDQAVELSRPGLGTEGTDKETFVSEGETLNVPLDISSIDEIDFFGIRATSTTTDAGSIKGVSGDPETPDEPVDPDEPQDATYDKVFFEETFGEDGAPLEGTYILAEEPEDNEFNTPVLPEDTEPTFENYVAYYEEIGGDVTKVESLVFYQNDEEGALQETFRIDAPEDGFGDADEMLTAYDDAIDAMDREDIEAQELMLAVSFTPNPEDEMLLEDETDEEPEAEPIL